MKMHISDYERKILLSRLTNLKFNFKNKMIYVLVLSLILIIIFSIKNQLLKSIIFLLYISYTYLTYKYFKDKEKIYLIILLGFSIRLIFIFLDYNLNLFPYKWDTTTFHIIAMEIRNNILSGNNVFFNIIPSINYRSYSLFSAVFYIFFGCYQIVIRIINAFLGVLIAKKIYNISLFTKLNYKIACFAGFLATFWPSYVLFTSLNMRESLIIFVTCDLIIRYFKFYNGNKKQFFILIIDFIMVGLLRKQNLPLYLFLFIIHGLVEQFRKRGKRFRIIMGSLVILFLIGGIKLVDSNILDLVSLRYFATEMKIRTYGGSAYLDWMEYNSIIDVFKYLPLRFLYFTFGPFIWDISNKFMFLVFLQSLVLMVLVLLTVKYFINFRVKINREMIFLILFSLVGLTANSIIDANYGTTFRHRMPYIISFFIFSSVYLERFVSDAYAYVKINIFEKGKQISL